MGVKERIVVKPADAKESVYGIARLQREHILDGTSLCVLVALGNVVALHPVAAALAREEKHRLVHRCRIDIFGEVLFPCPCPLRANAATCLLLEIGKRRTLDITEVADGNDDRVVRIEIFCIELVFVGNDLRTTFIAVLLLHLLQFCLHHFPATLRIVEDFLQILDGLHQLVKFLV